MKKLWIPTALMAIIIVAVTAVMWTRGGNAPLSSKEKAAELSSLPDDARVDYQCWNGKQITLDGQTVKQRATEPPEPGTPEHDLTLAKDKELRETADAVTKDGRLVINESDPQVKAIMEKYEAQELPQCES